MTPVLKVTILTRPDAGVDTGNVVVPNGDADTDDIILPLHQGRPLAPRRPVQGHGLGRAHLQVHVLGLRPGHVPVPVVEPMKSEGIKRVLLERRISGPKMQ